MLAEDNPVNQVVARSLLAPLGCEVEVAWSGEQALPMLDGDRCDLVLMDCMMPGLDGYETTAEIRAEGAGPSADAVVAMTASAMERDRERCLAAGMDDYLSKPVTRKVLAAVLSRWMPAVVGAPVSSGPRFAASSATRPSSRSLASATACIQQIFSHCAGANWP